MLMLEDLKNRPLLLRKLEQAIQSNKYFIIVSKGKAILGEEIISTPGEAKSCIASFKAADLVFAGVSHGNIVSPLFALSRSDDGRMSTLQEYLTFSEAAGNTGTAFFENELTNLSIFLSIFYPDIYKIKLPMEVGKFNNQECSVECLSDGYFLSIKKNKIMA